MIQPDEKRRVGKQCPMCGEMNYGVVSCCDPHPAIRCEACGRMIPITVTFRRTAKPGRKPGFVYGMN